MTHGERPTGRRPRGWVAVAAIVLIGAAGWLAWEAVDAPQSSDERPLASHATGDEGDAALPGGRARVIEAQPVRTVDPPRAGEIRVVKADGSPANARVYTTSAAAWSRDAARDMGRTGDDGVLLAEEREAEPRAYLWALGSGRIAGPTPVVERGQTLTLGAGARIRVHVRRPDGSAIAGASCEGYRWSDRGISDDDGAIELSGFAPQTEVGVYAEVFGGRYFPASERVTTGENGSVTDVDVVVEETVGPFVLVRVVGDVSPEDQVRIELSGADRKLKATTVHGDDPPLLVSLQGRAHAPVTISARSRGKRVVSRELAGLDEGTTTEVVLELLAGGVPSRGRVFDVDGSPAAGTHVDTRDRVLRSRGPVRTDEEGWFDVRVTWYGREILAARDGESVSTAVALAGDLKEIVLHLREMGAIEGVVRDVATRRPIEGASVGLYLDEFRGRTRWDSQTDADGRYRFSGLPPATFVLPVHIPTDRSRDTQEDDDLFERAKELSPDGLIREGIAHRSDGRTTLFHDFLAVSEPGGWICLRVVPAAGIELPDEIDLGHVWHAEHRPRTIPRYPDTLEGETEVRRFLKPGYHEFRATAGDLVGESRVVHVAGTAQLADVEIVMQRVRRVIARLVDGDGTPFELRDVEVTLTLVARGRRLELGDEDTDADGRVDLTTIAPTADALDRSDVELVFTVEGDGVMDTEPDDGGVNLRLSGVEWARRLREGGSEPLVVDVPLLDPIPVVVELVDTLGRPAAGVALRWWANSGNDEGYDAVTDERGCATLFRFADNDSLWMSADEPWVGSGEFRVGENVSERPRLTVDRRRTVRLRAVFPDGSPAAKRRVHYRHSGGSGVGTTDQDGELDVDVPASETRLSPSVRDLWVNESLVILAGATEAEFVVEPQHPVLVRLVFPPELRRPSFVTLRVGERREQRWVRIADEGAIEDRVDLPARPLRIEVELKHPLYAGIGHYDGESDDATVEVTPVPLRAVVLELVDEDGEPLRETAVHVRARYERRALDERGTTDVEGRITVRVPGIEIAMGIEMEGREPETLYYDPGDEAEGPIRVELPPAR